MPNSNIAAAAVQKAPCSFSSGSEGGVKGHGSPFCMFPKISAKSSGANRSNGIISPPLVGNDVCDRRLCKARYRCWAWFCQQLKQCTAVPQDVTSA